MTKIIPLKVTTGCYPVRFRADLPRDFSKLYWRGPHGQIANKNPAIYEYLQHLFSDDQHGFWPVPVGIGGTIPIDWKMDGVTEVRIKSIWKALWARLFCMRENRLDEENVFDHVLAKNSSPNGSIWWSGEYQSKTGFRTAVFIRARTGKRKQLCSFLEKELSPALIRAGANELRTHIFTPGSRLTWLTPGVCHREPSNRRYDAMLLIGANNREMLLNILNSESVLNTSEGQKLNCVAIHAYEISRTFPLTLSGQPQDNTWD